MISLWSQNTHPLAASALCLRWLRMGDSSSTGNVILYFLPGQ